ncbi:MAG: TolC family protein [Chitinophagaceae bacterium]|nr:TolC family protein [Chitinophagaceae bacterium]
MGQLFNKNISVLFSILASITPALLFSQSSNDSLLPQATIRHVVAYAIKHQPAIEQSLIDESITSNTIHSKLADWFPQVNFNYNLQHNFQVQTSIIGGNPVKLGVENTSSGQFTASQYLFNRDALLAFRSKSDVLTQVKQTTESRKIDLAVSVSKAYYDIIATTQQIRVADQNINRLEKSLNNAFQQYKAGLVDKTDYKRATIALNNTKALKQSSEVLLKAKTEYLKYLMGYPVTGELNLVYDSLAMEKEINLDTALTASFNNRIEYRILETQRKLQETNVKYNKWAFLPNVSMNGAYNLNYLNNNFGKLYSNNLPNSFAALTFTFPVFQGGKRKYNISTAELQLKRTILDIVSLKNNVSSQYASALANYKSNLANYNALKENVSLAQEVYDVINMQYRSGVKTYIEVITAETDLRTSQINYYNALYLLLASKIDVQKALGQVVY